MVFSLRVKVYLENAESVDRFHMKINNPALTAQILYLLHVLRLSNSRVPTMIELPVIDMLYGDKEDLIRRLV